MGPPNKFNTPWFVHQVKEEDAWGNFTCLFFGTHGAIGHSPKASERSLGYTRFTRADAERIVLCVNEYDRVCEEVERLRARERELKEALHSIVVLSERHVTAHSIALNALNATQEEPLGKPSGQA